MRTFARVLAVASLAAGTVLVATPASAAVAPAFGYGPAGFTTSAAPSSFLFADGAGEPTVGVNYRTGGRTGTALFIATSDVYKVSVTPTASSVGITWSDVTPYPPPINIDPILATDSASGLTFAGGDTGACSALESTTDDGQTWLPSVPCTVATDHPTVGIGKASADGVLPNSTGRVVYYCQQQAVQLCAASQDDGLTWTNGLLQTDCLSFFGHVKGGPDGTAYIPSNGCVDANGDLAVGGFLTTDNGLTYQGYGIPGAEPPSGGFDPSVTVTPDGTLYESWSAAGTNHTVVTWSKDHGKTWAPIVDLAGTTSPGLVASTFQTMTSGDNGRVAVAYLGTSVGKTADPFSDGYDGVWYLYVSTTLDGGKTWSTVKASDEPVQRGSIEDGGTTTTGQRNLLDFMDAQTMKDGRVIVAFADGCIGACNTSGSVATSQDAYATVAVQSTGRGLYAAYDVDPVTVPSAPVVSGTAGTASNALTWTVADTGGAPVTSYAVSRSVNGAPAVTVATTAVPSFTDLDVAPGTYRYTVTATNSAGTSAPSNVLTLTRATVPGTPTLTAVAGSSKVSLSWTTPPDGGAPITGYSVLRGTSPATLAPLTTVTGTSYVDSSAFPGTTYTYAVAATNSAGTGARSAPVSAMPTTTPGAAVLSAVAGKSGVSLTWTTPSDGYSPITSWTILRGTSPGTATPIQTLSNGTSYVDTTGTAGTTYYYAVVASNANGPGPASNEVSVAARKGGK